MISLFTIILFALIQIALIEFSKENPTIQYTDEYRYLMGLILSVQGIAFQTWVLSR